MFLGSISGFTIFLKFVKPNCLAKAYCAKFDISVANGGQTKLVVLLFFKYRYFFNHKHYKWYLVLGLVIFMFNIKSRIGYGIGQLFLYIITVSVAYNKL